MTSETTMDHAHTEWWNPGRSDWQVAVLFMIGSVCFAVGSVPPYAELVGESADGWTYFIGSLFFTSAALLQLLISAGVIRADERPRASVRWRTRVRTPDRAEWWAGSVQFIGTLMFNISTFEALSSSWSPAQASRRIWTPDARGSIAFLVASALVFADVRRPWLRWRPHDLGWSVAMLNMVGSIAFGASALAGYINPDTGAVLSVRIDDLGTLLGAICFFFGALLLIPDQREEALAGAGSPTGESP